MAVGRCMHATIHSPQSDWPYQPHTPHSTNHSPSDQFLALIDIGTVHPECRLCQYLADRHRRGEMNKVRA